MFKQYFQNSGDKLNIRVMYDINVNNSESKKRLGYAVFGVCALSCTSANVGYQTLVCLIDLIQFHYLDKRILFNDEYPDFSFYAPSVLVQKGVHYVNDRVVLCTPLHPFFSLFLSKKISRRLRQPW